MVRGAVKLKVNTNPYGVGGFKVFVKVKYLSDIEVEQGYDCKRLPVTAVQGRQVGNYLHRNKGYQHKLYCKEAQGRYSRLQIQNQSLQDLRFIKSSTVRGAVKSRLTPTLTVLVDSR